MRTDFRQHEHRNNLPLKVCIEGELLYPDTPYSMKDLRGKQVNGHLKTKWGRSRCNDNNYFNVRLTAQQSSQQREMTDRMIERDYSDETCSQNQHYCSPVTIYHILKRNSHLMHYKTQVEWSNLPSDVKETGHKILRALKTRYYWQTDENNSVQNPNNKLSVDLTINPSDKQYVSCVVKTPSQKVTFNDIPVPTSLQGMNIRRRYSPVRSLKDLIREGLTSASSVCRVNSRTITTFDGVKYQLPLSTCYSVLAKDCYNPEEPTFAVLIKKKSQGGQLKKMKVLCRSHQIELNPQSDCQGSRDCVQVKLNGETILRNRQERTIQDHGHDVVRVERTGPYVSVHLIESGVGVFFDGFSANIKMSPTLRNSQCGLCGHFNGEPEDEFRYPDNSLTTDVRSYYQKYTLKQDSCDYPQDVESICSGSDCGLTTDDDSLYDDYDQSYPESRSDDRQQPVMRTRVMETGSKICFSRQPVPTCPSHSYPRGYEQTRKVVYSCIEQDDPDAHTMRQQARRGQTPDRVQSLPTSFTEEELVPQSCDRF
jgi:hypothetical protein